MDGWICIHRKILNWEWYTDINTFHLFLHCILKANHKNIQWQGIKIKRGSFVTSFSHLSFETGLTVRQIRTSLNKLKTTQCLTSKGHAKYTVITVINYSYYQQYDKITDIQSTSYRQGCDKQATTNNNDNKETIEEEEEKIFQKFLKSLPPDTLKALKDIAFKQGVKYFKPWLRKIFKNNDVTEILDKIKSSAEILKKREEEREKLFKREELTEEEREKIKETLKKMRSIRENFHQSAAVNTAERMCL